MCVVLAIRTKVRRFAASTQLRSDLDVISWHEQFSRMQTSITYTSQTMLQMPLAVLILLTLTLALGLFSYTFLREDIFRQPVFFQLTIVTLLMTAFSLTLLMFSAQVRRLPLPRVRVCRHGEPTC